MSIRTRPGRSKTSGASVTRRVTGTNARQAILASEPLELLHQIRAPPSAAHFDLKLFVRARRGQRRLIGARCRERIEDIDDTHDRSEERNGLAPEPSRIPGAVQAPTTVTDERLDTTQG